MIYSIFALHPATFPQHSHNVIFGTSSNVNVLWQREIISKSRTGYQKNTGSAERYWHLYTEAFVISGGSKQAQAGASGCFRFAVWLHASMNIHRRTQTLSKSVKTKRIQHTRSPKVQDQSIFRCSSIVTREKVHDTSAKTPSVARSDKGHNYGCRGAQMYSM